MGDKGSKHDSIGKATLNTSEFYKPGSKGFVGWVKLKDCKKGEINISVTGKTIKPLEMEKRCDRLEAECKEQQGTIAQKKQQIDAMIAENGKLAEKKAGHIQSKQRYQSQLNELKNKISAQIEENSKKKEEVQRLETEKSTLKKKVDKEQAKIDEMMNKIKEETERLRAEEDQNEALEQEANGYRQQIDEGTAYTLREHSNHKTKTSNTSPLQQPLL